MRKGLNTETLKRIYARVARRYDREHAFITAGSDNRGRAMLVKNAVQAGDIVLDCGAGTGSTAIMAAKKVGSKGKVTLFDLSDDMLDVAREKVARSKLDCGIEFRTGNVIDLPFDDGAFDVVLSTYSLCPLYDPVKGALEMYRVTRRGGRFGAAHSTEPQNRIAKTLARGVEKIARRFPGISMGCRAVDVLPTIERAGGRVLFHRQIGVPLWPFLVFIVQKPGV
ncbi:MAG: class I SAM-dependent methyltransferase [bacterium]